MTPDPYFSVIIPSYNRASFIRTTIESVLNQNFQDFEIIVVDDGSTDNTGQIVKSISDRRIRYLKKENGERGAARNEGARNANGQFVGFFDSDDLLYPNHLSVAYEFLQENRDVKVFHIGYDIKDVCTGKTYPMPRIENINDQIISGNILSCNGVFVERTTFIKNPFNEDRAMATLEDWELWIRMASRFHFYNVNKVTSTILLHNERSVVSGSTDKVKAKAELFVKYVSEDKMNQQAYGKLLGRAVASVYMYTALHLGMAKGTSSDIYLYLRKGISSRFTSLLTKRFFVIIKFLILPR